MDSRKKIKSTKDVIEFYSELRQGYNLKKYTNAYIKQAITETLATIKLNDEKVLRIIHHLTPSCSIISPGIFKDTFNYNLISILQGTFKAKDELEKSLSGLDKYFISELAKAVGGKFYLESQFPSLESPSHLSPIPSSGLLANPPPYSPQFTSDNPNAFFANGAASDSTTNS
ncbi:MAG TPA: hypothetical protein VHA13_04205, partial [Gammaproteobacteria bacterium]|nr:hypothetical protein [Gammaproteobacteria bacterium]